MRRADRLFRLIDSHVLPPGLRARVDATNLRAPGFHVAPEIRARVDALHAAIADRRSVDLAYADAGQAATQRRVHPLGLFFWGGTWTLAAWCELRGDFRSFRLDRIRAAAPGGPFAKADGRNLASFLARYGAGGPGGSR